jgi:hypothetical protein
MSGVQAGQRAGRLKESARGRGLTERAKERGRTGSGGGFLFKLKGKGWYNKDAGGKSSLTGKGMWVRKGMRLPEISKHRIP